MASFRSLVSVAPIALTVALVFACSRKPPVRVQAPTPVDSGAEPVEPEDSGVPLVREMSPAYPVGVACSADDALAKELQVLPPPNEWRTLRSGTQKVSLRVPPKFFKVNDGSEGLKLESSLTVKGPGPKESHTFAINVRRVAKGIDAVLGDTKKRPPIPKVCPADAAFPSRTSDSFSTRAMDPVSVGFSSKTAIDGHPAYLWVGGNEGFNTDCLLIDLNQETIIAWAEWNAATVSGQPECFQRRVMSAVLLSLRAEMKAPKK